MKHQIVARLLIGVLMVFPASALASFAPNFNFDGILVDSSNNPITTSTTVKFQIIAPNVAACVLYEETLTVTPDAEGAFTTKVGANTNTGASPLTWTQIFQNGVAVTGAASCSYFPAANDDRKLRVFVNGTALSPDYSLSPAPMATVAETLDGIPSSGFVKTTGAQVMAGPLTLANQGVLRLGDSASGFVGFKAPATAAPTTYTWPAADAASSGYVLSSDAAGVLSWVAQSAGGSGTVTSVSAGTGISVTGTATVAPVVGLATVGTPGTYTKVTTDAYGRVTASSGLAESDIPTLSAGGKVATSALTGTISNDVWATNVESYLVKVHKDATTEVTVSASGSMSADYNLVLPVDDGAPNQILQTDGSGVLSWVSPGSGTSLTNVGGDITLSPASTTGGVIITSGANATSPTTGALILNGSGGIGAGGSIWSGGSITAAGGLYGTNLYASGTAYAPTLAGGNSASAPLYIESTTHATKGDIYIGASTGAKVRIGSATAPAFTLDMGGATDAVRLPAGNGSGQQPSPSALGLLRFNTTLNTLEYSDGSSWNALGGATSVMFSGGGSPASPGFSVNGDPNTGFYAPAADTLAVVTGGAKAAVFNTTATPVNYLSFTPAAVAAGPTIASAGADANVNLNFATQGTGNFVFNTGSVGIGTAAPVAKLDVNGAIHPGTDASACSGPNSGSLRTNGGVLEFCSNSRWINFERQTSAAITLDVIPTGGSDSLCNGSSNANTGSAPNCGFATLQAALDSLPEVLNHDVLIRMNSGTYTAPANAAYAIVRQRADYSSGKTLTIKGFGGVANLNGTGTPGQRGIVVLPGARNVAIDNFNFTGFQTASAGERPIAVDIAGAAVSLLNLTFSNNDTSISATGGSLLRIGSPYSGSQNVSISGIGAGTTANASIGLMLRNSQLVVSPSTTFTLGFTGGSSSYYLYGIYAVHSSLSLAGTGSAINVPLPSGAAQADGISLMGSSLGVTTGASVTVGGTNGTANQTNLRASQSEIVVDQNSGLALTGISGSNTAVGMELNAGTRATFYGSLNLQMNANSGLGSRGVVVKGSKLVLQPISPAVTYLTGLYYNGSQPAANSMLVCDEGSTCELNAYGGSLNIGDTGTQLRAPVILVDQHSTLRIVNSGGTIKNNNSSLGSAIGVVAASNNSTISIDQTQAGPTTTIFANDVSNARGFVISGNSNLNINASYSGTINFSNVAAGFEVVSKSVADVSRSVASFSFPSPPATLLALDPSSMTRGTMSGFNDVATSRGTVCETNMAPTLNGKCMDVNVQTAAIYTTAMVNCHRRGLHLCTNNDYANACVFTSSVISGGTLSAVTHWIEGSLSSSNAPVITSCNGSGIAESTNANSTANPYRCCTR